MFLISVTPPAHSPPSHFSGQVRHRPRWWPLSGGRGWCGRLSNKAIMIGCCGIQLKTHHTLLKQRWVFDFFVFQSTWNMTSWQRNIMSFRVSAEHAEKNGRFGIITGFSNTPGRRHGYEIQLKSILSVRPYLVYCLQEIVDCRLLKRDSRWLWWRCMRSWKYCLRKI